MANDWEDGKRFGDDMLNHQNPYAANEPKAPIPSADEQEELAPRLDPELDEFYVVGKTIECQSGVVLPEICIRTGETENLISVERTVKYTSPVTFLIGGALLAAALAKSCKVTYFISQEAKRRQTKFTWMGVGGILLGILCFFGAAFTEAMIAVGILVIVASFVLIGMGQVALKPTKHKKGTFWLGGFKPAFFDKLYELYGDLSG